MLTTVHRHQKFSLTNYHEWAEEDIEHYAEEHWLPHLKHQVHAIL